MTASVTSTVEVEIFGSTFNVRGGGDPARLSELASIVDGKMREVATHTKTVDTSKIAILAALNLAEELLQCRGGRVTDDSLTEKMEGLAGELEQALGA